MSIIKVKDLRKTYKVNIKKEGFKESIKDLIRPQYKTDGIWEKTD